MKAERWLELKEIVGGALDLPDEKRAAYLDQACGRNAELRSDVEDMLRSHGLNGNFLETPAIGVLHGLSDSGDGQTSVMLVKSCELSKDWKIRELSASPA